MGVIRIPAGCLAAILLGCVGFATAAIATVLSLIAPPEETHQLLFVAKILGWTAALLGLGRLVYFLGRPRVSTNSSPPVT
jgi:hypothetical protein